MTEIRMVPLKDCVEEMFIGPFGSSLKNECFVEKNNAFCMVYEQKHAIQKSMDVETRYVGEQKYEELKRFTIRGGDIIVSCRGTIGETYIVPEDAPIGIMHPSIMKIRLKAGVYDKNYFNMLLQKRLKMHEAEANGSGVKMAISATQLGNELFPLPSLTEQKLISDTISKAQTLIEVRHKELQMLDYLIKARFVEMFGGEKNLMAMSDICSIITDGTHQPPKFKEDGIPFIFVSNITSDKLTYEAEKFIDQDTYNELVKRTPIEIGDVLLSTVGSYGHPAVVKSDKKFLFQRHIAYLKPKKEIVDSDYLHGAILSPGAQRQIEQGVKGIAQKTLNLSEIKKMRIPIPNMDKQKEFATFVAQVDKSKSRKELNYKTKKILAS